jgi:hypothetical protein
MIDIPVPVHALRSDVRSCLRKGTSSRKVRLIFGFTCIWPMPGMMPRWSSMVGIPAY